MNVRQKKFIELVAQGRPAGRAYEEAGYSSKGEAADSCATKLLRNAQIKDYLKEMRSKSSSEAVWNAQQIKEGLTRMLSKAEEESDYTGFSGLADRLCKMEGYFSPEKHEVDVSTRTLKSIIKSERAKRNG